MGTKLEGLYRLSDVLQIPLKFEDGTMTGERSARVSLGGLGAAIKMNLRVVGYFSGEQTGVLIHVMGDLYVISAYFPSMQSTSLLLIDGEKAGGEKKMLRVLSKSQRLQDFYSVFKRAINGGFLWGDNAWKRLSLPS